MFGYSLWYAFHTKTCICNTWSRYATPPGTWCLLPIYLCLSLAFKWDPTHIRSRYLFDHIILWYTKKMKPCWVGYKTLYIPQKGQKRRGRSTKHFQGFRNASPFHVTCLISLSVGVSLTCTVLAWHAGKCERYMPWILYTDDRSEWAMYSLTFNRLACSSTAWPLPSGYSAAHASTHVGRLWFRYAVKFTDYSISTWACRTTHPIHYLPEVTLNTPEYVVVV